MRHALNTGDGVTMHTDETRLKHRGWGHNAYWCHALNTGDGVTTHTGETRLKNRGRGHDAYG